MREDCAPLQGNLTRNCVKKVKKAMFRKPDTHSIPTMSLLETLRAGFHIPTQITYVAPVF